MEYAYVYLTLAAVLGLFMAWGIGANDVANAMATSIGSKALTVYQAVIIAAIFEFAGAILAGGEVTSTIRKGIIDSEPLMNSPEILVHGMLASLAAAGTWLYVASRMGWPVSTTHSIVGAIIGFALIAIGMDAVKWPKVGSIALSWIASPLSSGIVAFVLFSSVQRLILETDTPLKNARRYAPVYLFLTGFVITLITLLKGLKHLDLEISTEDAYLYAAVIGVVIAGIGSYFTNKVIVPDDSSTTLRFEKVEQVFGVLMIVTACAMAFAHGSNDVANAIGPVAAVVSVAQSGQVGQSAPLPMWVLLLGGGGIVLGLSTYGRKVIETVGNNITQLTPTRGFAANLATAGTVVFASGVGMPISTTHTLIGAVLGVGMARGIAAIDLSVVRTIFISWIVTLPAGAALSAVFYLILNGIMG